MVCVLSSPGSAGEKFLCVTDKATGFHWNGASWETAEMNPNNEKFLVQEFDEPRVRPDGKWTHRASKLGEDAGGLLCERVQGDDDTVEIWCGGIIRNMMMNPKTLRFQRYFGWGYVSGRDEKDSGTFTAIGTCTKLE